MLSHLKTADYHTECDNPTVGLYLTQHAFFECCPMMFPLTSLCNHYQVPRCMSGWSECGRMSGGSGPCCVMCCSTSRMAEPASSGSVNRLQCETPNFLLVTQRVTEGLVKSCSPETLTSIITHSTRRAEMNRADVYITAHPTSASVS